MGPRFLAKCKRKSAAFRAAPRYNPNAMSDLPNPTPPAPHAAWSALPLAAVTLLLWSTLAALGARLGHLPPLLLTGAALLIGGLCGLPWARQWRVPLPTLLIGAGGLWLYHLLLFLALRLAPPLEANLLNYLWPLLIVVLTPVFFPHTPLRPAHALASLAGLLGAALMIGIGQFDGQPRHLLGYALAIAAALTWACYSLGCRRLPAFPASAVFGFCLLAGMLSLASHTLLGWGVEPGAPLWPALQGHDWALLVVLGAGPMGVAFLTWNAALRAGDPRMIGTLAYLTPLGSTLLLSLTTGERLTAPALAGMALIILGALLGHRASRV